MYEGISSIAKSTGTGSGIDDTRSIPAFKDRNAHLRRRNARRSKHPVE